MRLQQLLRGSAPREAWHRSAVGGMWDEIGPMQRDFLVSQGLQPHHHLLDIGCGSLRGGVHAIRYLEPSRYYGIDRNGELLRCARDIELPAHGIVEKQPRLLENEAFEFWRFETRFDFALAQSVFTHLPFNSIMRCLVEAARVLRPGGRLFATFFEQPDAFSLEPIVQPAAGRSQPLVTYADRDPFHYPVRLFETFCAGSPLEFRYFGDWGHPRNQQMLEFTRR
jgi:SAM-dependent methyltransferase